VGLIAVSAFHNMCWCIENVAPGFENSETRAWKKGLIAAVPLRGPPGINSTAADKYSAEYAFEVLLAKAL